MLRLFKKTTVLSLSWFIKFLLKVFEYWFQTNQQMASKLHLASLNVRGLSDRYKRLLLFDLFKNSKFAIILLQETKTTVRDENEIRKE